MSHFDEMTCLLYLDGQLDAGRARELAAHCGECAECGALLGALERESRWLHDALSEEEEALPARLHDPRHARAPVPWGWIAAFGFGAAGAYTLWAGVVDPMRQQLSQAGITEGNLLTLLLFRGTFWKGWEIMRSLIEFVALSTLGIFLLALLRRTWSRTLSRTTTVGVVLATLACALALPPSAAAAEIKKGDPNYTLAAGQTVNNDLIVFGGTVRIDGDVEGDLITFCHKLEVTGHVKGDVISWSQSTRISGTVDGNVRSATQDLELSGTVNKNATIWAGSLELTRESKINGSLTGAGTSFNLDGRIARDVLTAGNELSINGFVGGDTLARFHRLDLGSNADMQGRVRFTGRQQPTISSGAKLASPVDVTILPDRPNFSTLRYYWHQTLLFGAAFAFGLLLLLVMPDFFADVVRSSERYGPAFGFGALVLFATPIIAIIACVTVFGMAIGIAGLLFYVVSLYASQSFIGFWIGDKLLGPSTNVGAGIARLALGLLILRVVRAVPYLGGWIAFAVLIWGLGAMALTLYRRIGSRAAIA